MAKTNATWDLPIPPLNTAVVGSWTLFFECVASTQALALNDQRDGLVIVADSQTAGRGARGHTWHSAPGLGLWFSVALEGPAQGLAAAAVLAVQRAAAPDAYLDLKWPNDLMLRGRKVGGVLVEHRDGWNALGIGINVHHTPDQFPPELRETAGALEPLTGIAWDRAALLHDTLRQLDRMLLRLRAGEEAEIHEEWVAACHILGREVRQGNVAGRVVTVERDGALIVDDGAAQQRLYNGPIEFVGDA